jgi:hypothetical protein
MYLAESSGRGQVPRLYSERTVVEYWRVGVLEYWVYVGFPLISITPSLHHSNTLNPLLYGTTKPHSYNLRSLEQEQPCNRIYIKLIRY